MRADETTWRAYDERVALLHDLGPILEHLLGELLRVEGIRVHTVTHRIKSRASLERKLGDKGDKYQSLDDLHDLLGVRVITYFPDEVDRVAELVQAEFEVDHEHSVDKRALLDPDRFGYLSLHYICALDGTRAELKEHARFTGQRFEIQIRSILQHAWAEIEHDRGYQTTAAIPRILRRRFSRLAGLLELADAEFQALRDEASSYREHVGETPPSQVPIDQTSVEDLIKRNPTIAELDSHLAAEYADELEEPTDLRYIGKLAARLQRTGLTTIQGVTDALDRHRDGVRRFAEVFLKENRHGIAPRGITLFYLAYLLAAEQGAAVVRELVSETAADPSLAESILGEVEAAYTAVVAP
jgi:ppGpp synthetase/RelA/SpoT-type nucleotidyltranferase